MTEEREPGSDGNESVSGSDARDGLDAWMAANFPPEQPPAEPPVQTSPVQAWPPVSTPPVSTPPVSTPPVSTPPATASPLHAPPPTVAFGELAAEPPQLPPMAEELEGIPAVTEFPPSPAEAFAEVPGASGLDALFGESKFVEYEDGPSASENPFTRRPLDGSTSETEGVENSKGRKPQTVMLWIAGGLIAALALVTLFILGTKLPEMLGPAPGALVAPTTSPTPTPTPTELPLGPVEPGDYLWDELLGGECINPYLGPWEINYTVVECEAPHPAQLVTRGVFAHTQTDAETGVVVQLGYPGAEALQAQVNLLCTAPSVVDYSKATAYTDIQFEASYALSAQDWTNGNHYYYCFLSRSGGGELAGSLAIPPAVPPSEQPAP